MGPDKEKRDASKYLGGMSGKAAKAIKKKYSTTKKRAGSALDAARKARGRKKKKSY